MTEAGGSSSEGVKVLTRKPLIESASWCYRDKEEDVHQDFVLTIINFSRKINVVPNSKFFCNFLLKYYSNSIFSAEYIESDKFSVSANGMEPEWQLCLYPSGKDCEDEEHVSILLELVSRKVDIL